MRLPLGYTVRLTDFDTAYPYDPNNPQTHFHAVGTPYWMAPEVAACNYPEVGDSGQDQETRVGSRTGYHCGELHRADAICRAMSTMSAATSGALASWP